MSAPEYWELIFKAPCRHCGLAEGEPCRDGRGKRCMPHAARREDAAALAYYMPGRCALPGAEPRTRRITMWRDDLPHQIRLHFLNGTGIISVSCSCRKTPGGSFTPLETRTRWEAPEAMAVWRAHVAGAGAPEVAGA
jgi:hypothetical protein